MFNVIMGRRKAIILTSITILFLCSMGCQSATFGKGICCYVGDVKLSDTTVSVKLTFDNDTTGTLEISKSNKALGKNKIEEFYFASLEADTLTVTGEIFYDIKYLFKRGREKCYIYPLNASTDGVLFCDKSIRRIELKGKKETNTDSLFLSRIIDGDFFDQEHSEEQDYNLVIRHCWSHTDESYDETLSEGLSRTLRKYPKKIRRTAESIETIATQTEGKGKRNAGGISGAEPIKK